MMAATYHLLYYTHMATCLTVRGTGPSRPTVQWSTDRSLMSCNFRALLKGIGKTMRDEVPVVCVCACGDVEGWVA